jgi:peptidyl-dipeptidase Dcp
MQNNPLLGNFYTPFETTPFNSIKQEHFLPALLEAIGKAKKEIHEIADNPELPDFQNTLAALDFAGEEVARTAEIFFNLNSAETNDEIQKIARDFAPALTEYSNDILLHEKLFGRIKAVWDNRDALHLDGEEKRLLEKTYKAFVRNGALLNEVQKNELREINRELSTLSLKFGENVLAETNAYKLVIENREDLDGLPEHAVESAAEEAEQRELIGKWVITLDAPSYLPFMTYARNRELRRKLFMAYGSRAFSSNERNNQSNALRIADLRMKRANLLGYPSHAHFTLEERMAETPQKVNDFLDELLRVAKPAAMKDLEELRNFALNTDGLADLRQWDFAYYAEKLKKEKYSVDDEMLKPYFALDNVIDGIFQVAYKLYGISFLRNDEIEVYHPDVMSYEVLDRDGSHLAIFYADFFPRKGKRNGAWMTSYRGQSIKDGRNRRPHISIVCNFTKPTATKPSLLTFNEVTTLFHEFGHALHGILANTRFPSLSGTNVYWDFVELPSQIMENWCYEKECLDLFAQHFETGTKIPASLVEKLKASATFHEGYATLRQLAFGKLDMAWHSLSKTTPDDVKAFEDLTIRETQLLEPLETSNISCAFSHIFQGGYSAGYYSYKWAEVLDADAFEMFLENGLFDQVTALKFRELLSAGGTDHPMELYKKFRGHEPDVKSLLRRAGLA